MASANQQSVRIWQKKQLRLDMLTFRQRDMVQIGASGLLGVKRRLAAARGPNDGPAKPLKAGFYRKHKDGSQTWINAGWAVVKARKGKGRFRDLWFTGNMLRNLTLRTVTDNSAQAALTSRQERIKGLANARIEPWLVFSPANTRAVIAKAKDIFKQVTDRLVRQSNNP